MVYISQKVTLKSHVDVIHQQMKTCLNYPIQLHCRVILMCELYIRVVANLT